MGLAIAAVPGSMATKPTGNRIVDIREYIPMISFHFGRSGIGWHRPRCCANHGNLAYQECVAPGSATAIGVSQPNSCISSALRLLCNLEVAHEHRPDREKDCPESAPATSLARPVRFQAVW